MKPIFTLSIEDNIIDLKKRLVKAQVIDKNGITADFLTLELDDSDEALAFPAKGKQVALSFGYEGEEQYIGKFNVDEISYSSPANVLIIRASSANFRQSWLEPREISYHEKTLSVILGSVASRNGLSLAISGNLATKFIEHLDQTNESDSSFITRLAEEFHAAATVKDNKLIFVNRGVGESASGAKLETIFINRNDGYDFDYAERDREGSVSGAVAYYQDIETGTREVAVAGGGNHKRYLKQTYKTYDEAIEAAESALKKAKRQAKTLDFELSRGRPEIQAEMPIKLQGFKKEINAVNWYVVEVKHDLTPENGLKTSISCEEML